MNLPLFALWAQMASYCHYIDKIILTQERFFLWNTHTSWNPLWYVAICPLWVQAYLWLKFQRDTQWTWNSFPYTHQGVTLDSSTPLRGHSTTTWTKICHFLTPLPCVDSFYTLSVDKNRHFLTPSPLIFDP